MPKVIEISDAANNAPLRVTQRKRDGRLLVRCGYSAKSIEVIPARSNMLLPTSRMLKIAGVTASLTQWREVFCSILEVRNPEIFAGPRYIEDRKTGGLILVTK